MGRKRRTTEETAADRRRWPRAEVPSTAAVIWGQRALGKFPIANLSASGALIVGAPDLADGTRVRLLMKLPRTRRAVPVHATIVRREPRDPDDIAIGVQFVKPPAHVQDQIHRAVLAELELARSRRVVALVVDDCPDAGRIMSRQLGQLGHKSVVAKSPLEALDLLHRHTRELQLALVDLTLGSNRGDELLRVVAQEHPHIHRVLVSGEVSPDELRQAGRNAEAHAIIRKPWDPEALFAIAEGCVGA